MSQKTELREAALEHFQGFVAEATTALEGFIETLPKNKRADANLWDAHGRLEAISQWAEDLKEVEW